MEHLELQGNTLGEKHKYYNELVKKVIEQDLLLDLSPLNYHDSDLYNILKIDVASSKKDVKYILDVLKCEDMLYVSKAIKKSMWLITDEQYGHIINPKYIHSQLFPHMSFEAKKKFSHFIRLNLKKESRLEEFFNYYKDCNLREALKWLPNCSLVFIENAIKTHANAMNVKIIKRLCKKSIKLLEICNKHYKTDNGNEIREIMRATIFLMHSHGEEYLDLMETFESGQLPMLDAKLTKKIMKRAPHRIFNNVEKYAYKIDQPTFVKFIRPENVLNYLKQLCNNRKLWYWLKQDSLRPFILAMPQEIRIEFVKRNLIDKEINEACEYYIPDILQSNEDFYIWYRYMPFETAFKDIVQLTRAESSPSERISMLIELLHSAGDNMPNIQILLQYFHDNHINESAKFKKRFITALVEQIDAFAVNDQSWELLNTLFLSMEVYSESTKDVQCFIDVATMRKILRNENIPAILEKNFSFDALKSYGTRLNESDSEVIFNYLFISTMKEIEEKIDMSSISQFKKGVYLLKKILLLLSDCQKDLKDFPEVLIKIRKIIDINKINVWKVDLSCLYNVKKSWRKELFLMSLDLSPSQEVCINALKHDPKLIMASKHIMESLYCNNFIIFKQFLSKLRIYWSTSLANDSISFCREQITRGDDNDATIRHIIFLLPQKPLHDVIKKYAPEETIIDWNKNDGKQFNIRKNIAKRMYMARPQPSLEVVMWYAKGNYLQFSIPSLTAILRNMSDISFENQIQTLIDAPVSIRKYIIRKATDKLNYQDITRIFSDAWKSTKNKSIRTDLFKGAFKLLCKEKDESAIKCMWSLLENFINSLTDKENKAIYYTLGNVENVPLCVIVPFWRKSYQFLKTLPLKLNLQNIFSKVIYSAIKFMDIVDVDFLAQILAENSFHVKYPRWKSELISACLLSTTISESQIERYDKIFFPWMEFCIKSWDTYNDDKYTYRLELDHLLTKLCKYFQRIVVAKHMDMSVFMFSKAVEYLQQQLPAEENYTVLRTWIFTRKFIEIIASNICKNAIDKLKQGELYSTRREFEYFDEHLISQSIPQFGVELLQCLIADTKLYCPSIYLCFAQALERTWQRFRLCDLSQLDLLKSFLNTDSIESYLLVINLLPKNVEGTYKPRKREILHIISSHPSTEVKIHYYNYIRYDKDI